MKGGVLEGQDGLVRRNSTTIGQICAVILVLIRFHARPIPAARMRASWALERLAGDPLGKECAALVSGNADLSPADLYDRCNHVVGLVRDLVGPVPNPLLPEGYFPALTTARNWLNLTECVGEEPFLPSEWVGEVQQRNA
jgi:hypothetical protein